jgi:3-hydroxymyristoyl/3-hydroxydecanoyl-(acyl carrier protein) dehydratase
MNPLDLLPHRPPMRLLDEIVDLVPGRRAHGRRNLREDDFFFDGHFPDEPIVPAVILVEMIAQVGGLAAGAPSDPRAASTRPLRLRVAGFGPFKFPGAATPGARLDVEARVAGQLGGLFKIEGEVKADGVVVAVGSVTLGSAEAPSAKPS